LTRFTSWGRQTQVIEVRNRLTLARVEGPPYELENKKRIKFRVYEGRDS